MLVLRASSSRLTAVTPKNSSTGVLIAGIRSASKLSLPNLPKSITMPSGRQINKELKGSRNCSGQSTTDIVEEDVPDIAVGYEAIRSDPSKLHSMTVKELRTMARSVGVSAKGIKMDVVSALQCFFSETETGNNTDPAVEPRDSKSISSRREAKSLIIEANAKDVTTVSDVSEKKQKRSKRKQESVKGTSEDNDSITVVQQNEKQSRSRKVSTSKLSESTVGQIGLPEGSAEPWTVLAHKKPQNGWIPYNPKTMRPPPLSRDVNFLKLISWNVNGLRALLKLESFSALQLAQKEDFDVLCLQETKIQEKDVEEIKQRLIDGYDNSFWTCSVSKLGYSGTAIISRIKPVSVKYGLGISDHDSEGRLVTVEFETFYLLCGYVPNSGDGLKRLTYRIKEWDPSLSSYMKELEKAKPVILTGDLNCAHQEIDIYNPAGNRRSAGFTIEERESFETNFLSRGFVDTFRRQHPGVVAYTYWGFRHGGRKTNKGWRLDYFLVSESIADKVYDSYILPEVMGSDHCPLGLILKL